MNKRTCMWITSILHFIIRLELLKSTCFNWGTATAIISNMRLNKCVFMLWLNVKATDLLFQIWWAIISLDNDELWKIYLKHSAAHYKALIHYNNFNSADSITAFSIQTLHFEALISLKFNTNTRPVVLAGDSTWICMEFFLPRVYTCILLPGCFSALMFTVLSVTFWQLFSTKPRFTKDATSQVVSATIIFHLITISWNKQGLASSHNKPAFYSAFLITYTPLSLDLLLLFVVATTLSIILLKSFSTPRH